MITGFVKTSVHARDTDEDRAGRNDYSLELLGFPGELIEKPSDDPIICDTIQITDGIITKLYGDDSSSSNDTLTDKNELKLKLIQPIE